MAGDDIAMNQFQVVSDAPYIYVELADGSQGKIKKSDLVDIIAGLINPIRTSSTDISPAGISFRSAMANGIYSIIDPNETIEDNPGITYGILIVARTKIDYVAQIAIDLNGAMYSRFCNPSLVKYGAWVK